MGHYSVDSIDFVRLAVVDLDRFWHLSNSANCALNSDTICAFVVCSLGVGLVLGHTGCGRRISDLFQRLRSGAFPDSGADPPSQSDTATSASGLAGESP